MAQDRLAAHAYIVLDVSVVLPRSRYRFFDTAYQPLSPMLCVVVQEISVRILFRSAIAFPYNGILTWYTGNAKLAGLTTQLNLTGDRYNIALVCVCARIL